MKVSICSIFYFVPWSSFWIKISSSSFLRAFDHQPTFSTTYSTSRFHWCRARQRSNHMSACFSLPESINNRASLFSNNFVVPQPGFRVDWLANTSQYSKIFIKFLLKFSKGSLIGKLTSSFPSCASKQERRQTSWEIEWLLVLCRIVWPYTCQSLASSDRYQDRMEFLRTEKL